MTILARQLRQVRGIWRTATGSHSGVTAGMGGCIIVQFADACAGNGRVHSLGHRCCLLVEGRKLHTYMALHTSMTKSRKTATSTSEKTHSRTPCPMGPIAFVVRALSTALARNRS